MSLDSSLRSPPGDVRLPKCTSPASSELDVGGSKSDETTEWSRLFERRTSNFHDHYAVDGGKARIILAVLVTPAAVMEPDQGHHRHRSRRLFGFSRQRHGA